MTDTQDINHSSIQPATEESRPALLAADPHRPIYHFLPPGNWLNDPNGLIQWQGAYHLFYQYNPHGPFHGTIHWGHAVSEDLVHWTHLPIALAPTPGGPDEDGCYSGCAVNDDGVPTLVYSAHRHGRERPCIATSTDQLLSWQKHPGNPVSAAPPPDMELVAFRDHAVWRDGDTWYQLIGAGIQGQGGTALLYRSPNLIDWEYLQPIHVGDKRRTEPIWTGSMWECPDLFALDGSHVLLISVWDDHRTLYSAYFAGNYAEHRFTPRTEGIVDPGCFYAPQTMRDDQGRRLMWGWLRENRPGEAQRAAGWSGVMSLPRVLSIAPDGSLGQAPAPELQALRGRHFRLGSLEIAPGSSGLLPPMRGDTLEIVAEIDPGDATEVGVIVRGAPDGSEETQIVYDRTAGRLYVDRARSSLDRSVARDTQGGPLRLGEGEPLRLHVFLDRSVVEVFANGRAAHATRIYPTRDDSLGLDVFARGGSARLRQIDVWEMRSIW
jgi:beta-fructofuranosidase